MKFLVDEAVEYSVVLFLRKLGYDTISVAEYFPGIEDQKILLFAYRENRIIITNDKDFGELIYKYQFPHKGVIFFRLMQEDSKSKVSRLNILLEKYKDRIRNSFIVIDETKVRFRSANPVKDKSS